jgi:hypothetical protein
MGAALELDFLYWRADNTNYVVAFECDNYSDYIIYATVPVTGRLVRMGTKWDPGFRIGAGWNSDFDRWDLFADWTWYRNNCSKHVSTDVASNVGIFPQWPVREDAQGFTDVKGSWKMLHNCFDLELGRAFYITKALSLRPHWGLRGGWINQKFATTLNGPLAPVPDINGKIYLNSTSWNTNAKHNFWGIGPRLGIHSQWHIAESDWSILGKASTALLLGKTKMNVRGQYFVPGNSNVHVVDYCSENYSQLVPNLQIYLGLDWGTCLYCNQYYLGINLGWETNVYWNQSNISTMAFDYVPLPNGVSSNEAVTMEGLTLNAHFDF